MLRLQAAPQPRVVTLMHPTFVSFGFIGFAFLCLQDASTASSGFVRASTTSFGCDHFMVSVGSILILSDLQLHTQESIGQRQRLVKESITPNSIRLLHTEIHNEERFDLENQQ
jgi:hypothetical protein